jgi:hypothetical protein
MIERRLLITGPAQGDPAFVRPPGSRGAGEGKIIHPDDSGRARIGVNIGEMGFEIVAACAASIVRRAAAPDGSYRKLTRWPTPCNNGRRVRFSGRVRQ